MNRGDELPRKKYECKNCGTFITLRRDERIESFSCCKNPDHKFLIYEFSKEVVKQAKINSKNPKLLFLILRLLSEGHVGDDKLKLLTNNIAVSSLQKNPRHRQSEKITGDSTEGKTNLVLNQLRHMPERTYLYLTSGTKATLEDDVKPYNLIVFSEMNRFREDGANKNLIEIFKQLTEGGIHAMKKDKRSAEKTVRHSIDEQKSVIFTTTEPREDREAGTRIITGTISKNWERVKKVNERTFDYFSNPDKMLQEFFNEDSWYKCMLTYFFSENEELSNPHDFIYQPYAKYLKERINENFIFDYSDPRSQRDIKRILSLTNITTWLYQMQRKKVLVGDKYFLIGAVDDFILTLNFVLDFFNQSYTGMDARLLKALELVGESWTDRKILEESLGVTRNTIKDYCKILSEQGVIEGSKGCQINEISGLNSYDKNRIYYRRCQKGVKKRLIRCQLQELESFLRLREENIIDTFDIKDFIDDKHLINNKKRCQKEGVKKPQPHPFTLILDDKKPKIDTFKLTPFNNLCNVCGKPDAFIIVGNQLFCKECAYNES